MKELRHCLAEYAPAMLRGIAYSWGAEIAAGEGKAKLVEILADRMLSAEALAELLKRLSPAEARALAQVAQRGAIPAYRLTREYGEIRRFGPGSLERVQPWLAIASPTERLWYLGLIYRDYGRLDDYHGEIYFIPPDLLSLLPPLEVSQPRFQIAPAPAPAQELADETALARDILAILSYLRREQVAAQNGPYLTRQDIAKLRPRLTAEDEGRLAFCQHLMRRAGLIQREGRTLKPSLKAREWLQAPPVKRMRLLYETWRDDRGWNELRYVPGLSIQDTGRQVDPRAVREKILGYLRQSALGQWYAIAAFAQAIKEVDPDFLRPDGDYDSWYIRDVESNRYLAGFESWDRVEGALIAHFLAGPLFWLGITRLSHERDAAGLPVLFSFTDLGAALLELPGAEMPDMPERELVVQADFTVIATREANLYDRYQLERFAEWESQDAAAVYRITNHSVWRSLQEGIGIKQILAFLRRASGGRLPQNVMRTLQEWGAKFGQVTLSRAVLLTTKDEQTMREIRASPRLRPYLGQAVSRRASMVDESKIAELIKILQEAGYWPQVEELK